MNMSEKLSAEEQEAIDQLSEAIAKELAEGKSEEKIAKELIKQGWPEESATAFVGNVKQAIEQYIEQYKESPEGRQIMASKYKRHMLYGFLWAAGGTVVTVATYSAASGGGFYFVAWGAILFGIIDFLRGLYGWLKYR